MEGFLSRDTGSRTHPFRLWRDIGTGGRMANGQDDSFNYHLRCSNGLLLCVGNPHSRGGRRDVSDPGQNTVSTLTSAVETAEDVKV